MAKTRRNMLNNICMCWIISNDNSSIFLTWLYSQRYNVYVTSIQSSPYLSYFSLMFGRCRTPTVRLSLLLFRIDCPIVHISTSLVLCRVFRCGSFTLPKRSWSHGLRRKRRHLVVQNPISLNDNVRSHTSATMGGSVTSSVHTRYGSIRLRSLRQSERTTARDRVQHKGWTFPCYRAVNKEYEQRWARWWCTTPSKHLVKFNKGATIQNVHKCCTPVNKAMSEILNCCHYLLSSPCTDSSKY